MSNQNKQELGRDLKSVRERLDARVDDIINDPDRVSTPNEALLEAVAEELARIWSAG